MYSLCMRFLKGLYNLREELNEKDLFYLRNGNPFFCLGSYEMAVINLNNISFFPAVFFSSEVECTYILNQSISKPKCLIINKF